MVPGMFKVGGDYSDIASQYVKNFNYIQEKRKAADDAFDKYIQTQAGKVDQNAVRSQDREALDGMYKDWVSYGIKNKKRIVSDPAAKMEFENKGRSLSRFVEDSKNEEKKKSPLPEVYRSGKVVREKAIEAIASHDQPLLIKEPTTGQWIQNPNRKSLDFTETIWNAKTPNIAEIVTKVGSGKKRIKIEGVPLQNDPKTAEGRDRLNRYKMLRPIKEQYTPQSVKEIGDLTADYALSDESIKNGFDFEYENIKSKPEYDALNNAYKRYYGKDQNISDGLSYARAKGVLFAEQAGDMYEEEIEDTQRLDARSQARKAQSEARADARSGGVPSVNVFDVIDVGLPDPSYTGTLNLPNNKVPAKLRLAMKGIGYEPGFNGVDILVENGQIIGVAPAGFAGGLTKANAPITREEILIGQQKAGQKIDWGKKSKSKDRLGLGF